MFPSTATSIVSLICDILMVKEDFYFSFRNQTLEVTFLKSFSKSKEKNILLKLSLELLLCQIDVQKPVNIFDFQGPWKWLCCFDILSWSKMASEVLFWEEKTGKENILLSIKLIRFVPATFAQQNRPLP